MKNKKDFILFTLALLFLALVIAYTNHLFVVSLDAYGFALSVRADEWHKYVPLVRLAW